MRELTIELLVKKHNLLEEIEDMSGYSSRICLDDYYLEEHEMIILCNELENTYEGFSFEVVPVFGGFAQDLLITNRKKKTEYDAIPKTKKRGDVFKALHEKHSTITSAMFSANLNEAITEKEYESQIEFYDFLMNQIRD
ncbi:hypothetical protein NRIC_37970 [Enterococcus florum]|uniref:Uncharacterized protein n=1 Tax=Enterococcus florum TaxID=2480627 RepID=A0A4P5PDB0_9ENTE|nr:hypothetical protein [Enterococcus florum]GCF95906.1 hypothetical protein NRIC_37970 [Enterococcus florum]